MKKLLFAFFFLIFLASFQAYGWADITSDLASGMDLSQIMRNALTANSTIEDIVARCIEAGADCVPVVHGAIAVKATSAYSIVYAAVKAKPDRAADILRAALGTPGINPEPVITAAATASPAAAADIRTAALLADVPEAVVDAALSVVAGPVPVQPGFGYARGATFQPGSIGGIGGTGGTGGGGYGGGGGGAPASPSR